MLTGKVVTLDNETPDEPAGMIAKMVDRVSEPVNGLPMAYGTVIFT